MASGPCLLDLNQKRITVAIKSDFFHCLRMATTFPFIQYFCRERLQKWVLPVSIVDSNEARFIHAIMRTLPV